MLLQNYLNVCPDFRLSPMIPKSLFIRLRRICSDLTDFYISSNKLIKQLFSRGYNIFSLYKIRNLVSNFNRANLIP